MAEETRTFMEKSEISTITHSIRILTNLPFLRRHNFHDARLHSVFIDLRYETLEVTKLVHGLGKHPCQPDSI